MTSWTNNLNGIASGTTVTAANSGGTSGTAFSGVDITSGVTVAAQSAAAYEGSTGLQIQYTSTGFQQGGVYWTTNSPLGTRLAASFWYKFAATPADDDRIFQMTDAAVRLTSTRNLTATGPSNVVIGTSTTVPANTWVFVQLAWTPQSTNTSRLECTVTGTTGTVYLNSNSSGVATGQVIDKAEFGRADVASGVLNTHSYDLLSLNNTLAVGSFPGSAAPSAFTGGMKVWNGSAWVIKPVKVWNGSAWVVKPVKRWNGTAWVLTP